MKILFAFLMCFSSLSLAMTKAEFLNLDESAKQQFLETQASALEGEEDIQNFMAAQPDLMRLVLEAGESVSNIWGDTILEGPYSLTGDIETTVSTIYTSNNEVYAVYATVSAPAILTDSCDYNDETNQWDDDCMVGNISESFVLDAEGNTIDMGYYAEFSD